MTERNRVKELEEEREGCKGLDEVRVTGWVEGGMASGRVIRMTLDCKDKTEGTGRGKGRMQGNG